MITIKILIIAVLIVLGLYWLAAHTAPFPLSHEQLGLYSHDIHRIIGVVFLVGAGVVAWKMKSKK